MLIDAVVLMILGILATLLPLSAAYRARQVRRLMHAGARLHHDQRPELEVRAARPARAAGMGIILAGLALLVTALAWPTGSEPPSGGFLVASLAFTFGTGGLAVVEILRPGVVADGPRTARATAPTVTDYVDPQTRTLCWVFTGAGLLGLLVTLALTGSPWWDTATVWRSPIPFLLAAVPIVTALSEVAMRRVLGTPQPARDEADLYWQDAVRASTLTSLTVPPALVGLLALMVCGAVLDDAASAAAVANGQVGPDWSLWLLVGGYALPFVLVIAAMVVAARRGGAGAERFRVRLWDGRPAGGASVA